MHIQSKKRMMGTAEALNAAALGSWVSCNPEQEMNLGAAEALDAIAPGISAAAFFDK